MDETLEVPRPRTERTQEGEDHSSGDEDGGLDWSRLPKSGAAARPIIPKRGEKDFEPASGGGSGLQLHVLDRSRDAMLETLRANRTISSKAVSYGIWYPSIDRVHVTTARGIHFSTMGHSVSRINTDCELRGSSKKLPKRLELLPEEALYLIERGALFCYKSVHSNAWFVDPSNHEAKSPGAPMSVQQTFAEMIGRENITLERYQVYAYLKRLGFILIRAEPPAPEYPVAPCVSLPISPQRLVTRWPIGVLSRLVSNVIIRLTQFFYEIDWWKPLQLYRLKTTQDIFRGLRFIPCGHTTPLYRPATKPQLSSASSPYNIFFHVYKPSTPFRKTAPPTPDFYLVVVDARTTSMPSLQELAALFGVLPEMPLPPPRKRGAPTSAKQTNDPQPANVALTTTPKTITRETASAEITITRPQPRSGWPTILWAFFRRLLSCRSPFLMAPSLQEARPTFVPPKPNPFLALKTGKKTIVIAAVDAGNISFFRFGQGVFEEWPML